MDKRPHWATFGCLLASFRARSWSRRRGFGAGTRPVTGRLIPTELPTAPALGAPGVTPERPGLWGFSVA